MERYIQRNWFRNLKKEASESGKDMESIVMTDKDTRPARLIQIYAGWVGFSLILMGFIILLIDLMGMDQGTLKTISFIPIIMGGGLYGFYKTQHPNNKALKDLASAALYVGSFISILGIVFSFEVLQDGMEGLPYIVYFCVAIGIAITFVENSALTAYFVLYTLLTWAIAGPFAGFFLPGLSNVVGMIVFWGFMAAILYWFHSNVKMGEINLKTVLLGWSVAVTLVVAATMMTGGSLLIALSGLALGLYVLGKEFYPNASAFWNRPFEMTGYGIAALLLIIGSQKASLFSLIFGLPSVSGWEGPKSLGFLIALAMLGGALYYYYENYWSKNNKLNQYMAVPAVLAVLVFLLSFAKGDGVATLLSLMFYAGGLALFGSIMMDGANKKHPPSMLAGLVLINLIIFNGINSVFGGSGLNASIVGVILIAFGAGFFFVVKLVDEKFELNGFKGILDTDLANKVLDSNPISDTLKKTAEEPKKEDEDSSENKDDILD